MQLLDASLAFVLTLAALATVVTTIMEACFRMARMRKKNLIDVMKLLNKEIGKSSLNLTPKERWAFFSKVIENPAETTHLISKIDWQENSRKNEEDVLTNFLETFGKRGDRKGIYSKVTLEYVLRCLAESDSVKRTSSMAGDRLRTELNRIARKYEEFGSAVSASFKQYAQAWSIGMGILLALAANIDGIRIFEAYTIDPRLAAAVIEKQEDLIEKNQEVRTSMKNLNALYLMENKKENEIRTAEKDKKKPDEINKLKNELNDIQNKISEQSEIAAIQKTVQSAKSQVYDLKALGVPIGWDFYPNCPSGFFIWFLKVAITGFLIGLGAPFWFDVAKRLSQIRRGLKNPNSSDEDRLAARDANGDADERKKIVDDVVSDTLKENQASAFGRHPQLTGLKGLIL